MDVVTLAIVNKKIAGVLAGIDRIEVDDVNRRLIFYFPNGTTATMNFPIPRDGASIVEIKINEEGKMVCRMSDNRVVVSDDPIQTANAATVAYKETTVENVLNELTANGGGVLKEAIVPTGDLLRGKNYPAGTPIENILRDLLCPYAKPTVTLTINPSTTLYDKVTDVVNSIGMTAKAVKATENISKVEFYVGNILVNTVTSGVENGGTFTYAYNTTISTDTTFKAVVTDTKGGSNTSTKSIKFVGRSYYGIVDASLSSLNAEEIKAHSNTLKDTKKLTYAGITTDMGKVYYAYPTSFGALTSIKDLVNNLNYTTSFTQSTVSVDGMDYYVYLQIDSAAATNVELTFA